MPSPLAHAMAGLAVHIATAPRDRLADRARALVTVGAAVAPDLDLLWKLVDGVNHHQAEVHSVGAGLAVALAAGLLAARRGLPRAWDLGLAAFLGWCSHLLLDLLNVDTSPPVGLMALWPLSAGYYKSPWPVFLDIGRTLNWRTVRHDTLAVAWEVLVLSLVLVGVWRRRARPRPGAWSGARIREQVGG